MNPSRRLIMVATTAFGMGIDKPNIRYILHYQAPGSLERTFRRSVVRVATVAQDNAFSCSMRELDEIVRNAIRRQSGTPISLRRPTERS